MEIGYTPEQLAMQQELRAYYEKLLDPATVAELARVARQSGEAPRRIWKQMCADGWAGIGWPKEYGGQGRYCDRAVHLLRRVDARRRARCRCSRSTASVRRSWRSAPTSRRPTTCPRILAGDIHFCIGYSEPGAGTDLASLKTRRCATASRTSSTARRCGRRSPATPTTAGWRCAPIPTRRSTRASR